MTELILITGGSRSGKSAHALQLADAFAHKVFIATAEAFDDEMRERISRHQSERGPGWKTVEAPIDLAAAIRAADDPSGVIVVDCLTVWLGNLMFHEPDITEDAAPCVVLLEALQASSAARLIVVTNEVGMGIVPETALGRRFRDLAGRINQRVAAAADRVFLSVCGQTIRVK